MQVYKTFLKIALLNISSGIIYLVIYISLSFILANINLNSKSAETFTAEKIDIAVIDRDNSEQSRALTDYLSETQNIVDIGEDESTWPDEMYYHIVQYILVIEKDFEKNISSGNTDGVLTSYESPDSNSAYIVASQVETYMSNMQNYIAAGYDFSEASKLAAETSHIQADVSFPDDGKELAKPTAMNFFFRYIPYMMVCILINSMGVMLVIWNRPAIKARTEIAGISLGRRNMEMAFAMITYSAIIFAIFFVLASMIYRKEFFTIKGFYSMINMLCYLLVSVSITYLISQLSKKAPVLNMWSNVIGLSTSFLCGVFVERALLPDKIVQISKCLPTYWYINVVDELMYFDGSLSSLAWKSMGVQLLFALAIYIIGLVVCKARQQKNA